MINPDCEHCSGTGFLDIEETHMGVPMTKPCPCLMASDLIRNMDRGWSGLSSARKVHSSQLSGITSDNAYITSSDDNLKAHLRHVALRMGPWWGFKVVSDSDLMVAWLSPASLMGKEIIDPDAASVSSTKATLVDLVEPPDLMILRTGVKTARNSAMPEVFLEAINHRAHIDKPTWIVDQPSHRFDANHLCFSNEALEVIKRWERIDFSGVNPVQEVTSPVRADTPSSGISLSLSDPVSSSTVRRTTIPTEKPNKFKRTRP